MNKLMGLVQLGKICSHVLRQAGVAIPPAVLTKMQYFEDYSGNISIIQNPGAQVPRPLKRTIEEAFGMQVDEKDQTDEDQERQNYLNQLFNQAAQDETLGETTTEEGSSSQSSSSSISPFSKSR